MAIIRPFPALRPKPELAARICELPYDVVSREEAHRISSGNPLSFFRVSRPEVCLPFETDPYSLQVYQRGASEFKRLIDEGALVQDSTPRFYLYRQIMGRHVQTGLAGVASCEDYLKGVIRKHELTRFDKENDRVRHIESLDVQTGPAFLTYRSVSRLNTLVEAQTKQAPEIDFKASDEVRHMAWVIADKVLIGEIEAAFSQIPLLYIADGHHRTAAAARVYQNRQGRGSSGYFLAVIFPHDQLQILPYHRVVKDLNGYNPGDLLSRLEKVFEVVGFESSKPSCKHELCMYLSGKWRTLRFRPEVTRDVKGLENLDVELLQRHVLGPVFGIDDPRRSERIGFVGGIRGAAELERLVDAGEYACAFAMYPTAMEALISIADIHGIMPPKSTWFEPKLRDAMFCHLIE